jgi:hypothetical protein
MATVARMQMATMAAIRSKNEKHFLAAEFSLTFLE